LFEKFCSKENIDFKAKDHHIGCLAHIINLAVQEALKGLKASAPTSEGLSEYNSDDEDISNHNVVSKVSYNCVCSFYFLFY
jgi:hypothetical protein